MTTRHVDIAAVAIACLILARVALNMVVSPMDRVRNDIAASLAAIPEETAGSAGAIEDFERIAQDLEARPALWEQVVPPAPPPAPPPPPTPNAPDLAAMLQDISVGRAQIGSTKIKVFGPEFPHGEWFAIGDSINGCTLASFTRDEAVFSYFWEKGNRELTLALPRN